MEVKMKRIIFCLCFLMAICGEKIIAHKQWVHPYFAREGYQFLKLQVGEVPAILNHLGFNEIGTHPWTTGKIVTGAYREDLEDPVFRYAGANPLFPAPLISITHFWLADEGDYSRIFLPYTQDSYENAYVKALHYLLPAEYGRWTAEVPWPSGYATVCLQSQMDRFSVLLRGTLSNGL
jgi:hypothetical protein